MRIIIIIITEYIKGTPISMSSLPRKDEFSLPTQQTCMCIYMCVCVGDTKLYECDL